uniref:Secreted frizzled related protein 1/5 n=1 Tax=Ptychodera flava TaxID=63121 RepID=A0A0D3S302_PTYFL|nr:secreted frizzled related protein 1/5 [Ptychodera flava]
MKMSCWRPSFLRLPTLLYFFAFVVPTWSYAMDLSGRITKPTCVPIPKEMSLCANIGYNQMRMPNLLDHDSIPEVKEQASSWVPLVHKRCHPGTQLFLCSLFAPVCLDRPIYPCRSLCEQVRDQCSPVMLEHGYPWPEMLRCNKLPLDNDLCIKAQMKNSTAEGEVPGEGDIITPIYEGEIIPDSGDNEGKGTPVCDQCHAEATEEKIITEFCNADFAVKTKIQETKLSRGHKIVSKGKKKSLQERYSEEEGHKENDTGIGRWHQCTCEFLNVNNEKDSYLIMGRIIDKKLVVTFAMPWSKSRDLRKASRRFKNEQC